MRRKKKPVPPHPNQFVALDQNLHVFAGYNMGYPVWSANIDDYKLINNSTHLNTLRSWFPEKTIELTVL